MSMAPGRGQGRVELNVTPLIDVLLVLLIIFMVIMPSLSNGLKTVVPQAGDQKVPAAPRDDIVITVLRDHTVRLNQEPVDLSDLERRLHDLFKRRASCDFRPRREGSRFSGCGASDRHCQGRWTGKSGAHDGVIGAGSALLLKWVAWIRPLQPAFQGYCRAAER